MRIAKNYIIDFNLFHLTEYCLLDFSKAEYDLIDIYIKKLLKSKVMHFDRIGLCNSRYDHQIILYFNDVAYALSYYHGFHKDIYEMPFIIWFVFQGINKQKDFYYYDSETDRFILKKEFIKKRVEYTNSNFKR